MASFDDVKCRAETTRDAVDRFKAGLAAEMLFLPHGIMNTMRYSEGSMSLHSR